MCPDQGATVIGTITADTGKQASISNLHQGFKSNDKHRVTDATDHTDFHMQSAQCLSKAALKYGSKDAERKRQHSQRADHVPGL